MPQLGETVSEGTVTRWLRGQGDTVAAGDPLLEIASDKVSMEVPSLQAGVLLEILAEEGETVPVGAALAWLEVEGEDTGDGPAAGVMDQPAASAASVRASQVVAAVASQEPSADTAAEDGHRPSPLIRRLLAEAGLTAEEVTGTGPGGRIRREDVAVAVAARVEIPPASAPQASLATVAEGASARAAEPARARGGRTEPLSRLRKVIAERMVSSLRTSAQLTSVVEVDVTRIADLRVRANAKVATIGVKLSFLPFFSRAAVEALQAHPDLNASVDTGLGTVTHYHLVHLGIAVDTDGGLLVPVIRDAGRLSVIGLAHAIADVAERTRSNGISPDELSGGTFTVTNTGSRGALFDTPIINQPQVAILATGGVVRRPAVVTDPAIGSEGIAIRSMVYLALTYDHRFVDGALAARFLVAIKSRLEDGRFESDVGLPQR
jgi:pyruvate dehydrogenase E2 component (dihydrolipoamide acetyltransferase)